MKHKTYKFRLYPNTEQKILIDKTFGCCRFVYNYFLSEKIEYYKQTKSLKGFKHNSEKELKKEYDWLKEVDSTSLQQERLNLETAYKTFFNKVKKGEVVHLKFKSKHDKQSYRSINNNHCIKVDIEHRKIKIPKIGYMNYRDDRIFDTSSIKFVTVSKNNVGQYYVSILTEEDIKHVPNNKNIIGIDLGVKTYITCSNGEKVDNPKILNRYEKKMKICQRKLSKKQKGSNNKNKQRIKLAKIHNKVNNIRTDFLQKLTTRLINENQIICLEDLKISEMVKNNLLSKSIYDCSWYEFKRQLLYKADWYGRHIVIVDKYFPSSKLCSSCGYKLYELKLSTRQWICPNCNKEHDRDFNASINILQEGIKLLATAGIAESNACRDMNKTSSAQETSSFRKK